MRIGRRLIDGAVWSIVAKMIALFAGLFTTTLLTRMLPLTEIGVYFLAASIIKISSVVGQLGLGRVGVRRVSEALVRSGGEVAARIGMSTIRIGLLGAVLVALLVHQLIIPWAAQTIPAAAGLEQFRNPVALMIVAAALVAVVSQVQRGFHSMRMSSLFGGAVGPVLVALSYVAILQLGVPVSLDLVMLVTATAGVITAVLAFAFLYPQLTGYRQAEPVRARRLIEDAWPFWIASIGSLVIGQSDIWIVAAVRSAEEVANYGAAVRLLLLAALPTAVVSSTVQSTVSELHARGQSGKIERVLRMSNIFATLPTAAILVTIVSLPGSWMGTVFGEPYRNGAVVLAILAGGDLVAAILGTPAMLLRMMDHERLVMKSVLVSGSATIGLSVLFVLPFGSEGVALAFAIGIIGQRIVLWRYVRSRLGMRTDVFALRKDNFREAIEGISEYASKKMGMTR